MAKLTTKQRKKIPSSKFALKGRRFPIEDKAHAVAAERLAPRAEHAGSISPMQEAMIERKAKAKIKRGGK